MNKSSSSTTQIPGPHSGGGTRPPGFGSLALLASIVVTFLAASSVPTPLYILYAREWNFSPVTITVIFGVYAIAVLFALLILGRISDYIGRRPVLLVAIALQIAAMFVLISDVGVASLMFGRILQGISTGGALGTLGAAMIDIDRRRGAIANSFAPGFGSGAGALVSGVLVQYAPAPTHLVYAVLICTFVVQGIGVMRMPETVTRKPWERAALIPELALPVGLRRSVLTAAPIVFAVWALAGFYGSLGPTLARQLSDSMSAVVGSLGLFILAVMAAGTTFFLERMRPRAVMLFGIVMLLIGLAGIFVSVEQSSMIGFFISTSIVGVGFGAGFQSGMRTVVPHAAPHERAGVLSILYVICYLGMGVPSVIAGILVVVDGGGVTKTACGYTLFIGALAIVAFFRLISTRSSKR